MQTLPPIFAIAVALVLGWVGWFFLFRTAAVVEMNRRFLDKGGTWNQLPYSGLMRKSWFPLFIRCQGIVAWVGMLLLLGLAASVVIR
ncbi:MAG: hypothetical protein ACLGXA_08340 [Acidobacteriota bacterium]